MWKEMQWLFKDQNLDPMSSVAQRINGIFWER